MATVPRPDGRTAANVAVPGSVRDHLAQEQKKTVIKLRTGEPGALEAVNRDLEEIGAAASGFPADAEFRALKGFALKDAYQSSKGLRPSRRAT